MPYINVKVTTAPDPALIACIAEQVSALTARHLGKDPAVTSVSVEPVDPRFWFVGGRTLADLGTRTYWLDIKITDATNTKRQIADYLEAVHATMSEVLGGVTGTSYIHVDAVPAANWGFGGKSQEYRFIAGQLAPRA